MPLKVNYAKTLQELFERRELFFGRGPACDEAAGAAPAPKGLPEAERHVAPEARKLPVRQNKKLLVGRGVQKEGIALFQKHRLQAHGHVDGMAADLPVKPVGKESVKLLAHHARLGKQRALLLDDRHEMRRHVAFGVDQRLAAQSADLGAADVENVGKLADIPQRHVGLRTHQPVAEPRPVEIQGQTAAPAGIVQGLQLRLRVQGAVLRGVGDIHHAGADHVLVGLVGEEGVHVFCQRRGLSCGCLPAVVL